MGNCSQSIIRMNKAFLISFLFCLLFVGMLSYPRVGGLGDWCEAVEDCPEMGTFCNTETNTCEVGCDTQEDCPEGTWCIVANHMCQCRTKHVQLPTRALLCKTR